MGFLNFSLRRIIYGIVMIFAVIIFNFFLIQLAPGDPAEIIAGEAGGTTPKILAEIRAAYGLDKSLPEQFAVYIKRMLSGDLGKSFYFNQSVTHLILQRVPETLLLVITAQIMAVLVGTLFGAIASQKPYGILSHSITILALAAYSAPVFWTGIMLIILFAHLIPVFPSFGIRTVGMQYGTIMRSLDILYHLVLPAFTLAIIYVALYARLARASMLEVLRSDFIRMARSKGLHERIVVYKHALKNAVLPVITVAGLQFSQVFAGAIIVETVFNWPGLGQLAFDSILRRDHPLLIGILFFSSVIVIIINILTDLSYRIIDPRIKKV